jgi:arylsulfatase A-like enzyme
LIRLPGAQQTESDHDELVSLIDIAPTVLGAVGVPRPKAFHGSSLLPLLVDAPWPRRQIYMECWGWERLKAARSQDGLVIFDLKKDRKTYIDLDKPDAEAHPLSHPGQNEELARLDMRLKAFIKNAGATTKSPKLDNETIKKLKSLGYLP